MKRTNKETKEDSTKKTENKVEEKKKWADI
jgi:hypothetical protein